MVYLPPSYEKKSKRRYPVIYWLSGRGGNPKGVGNYVALYHQAILDGAAPEGIIIGVNGVNSSMYTNDLKGEYPIETVIVKDLIGHVDKTYRTKAERSMRAINGFSMGGFGAARLGFKYPELFGVVSIVGTTMHRPEVLRDMRQDIYAQVFGNNLEYCTRHSPWTILEQNADRLKKNTLIRQFVGEKDMLVEKNKRFHQRMKDLGITHEFAIVNNARHNYNQVYANWDGHPFAFYARAFGSNVNGGNAASRYSGR